MNTEANGKLYAIDQDEVKRLITTGLPNFQRAADGFRQLQSCAALAGQSFAQFNIAMSARDYRRLVWNERLATLRRQLKLKGHPGWKKIC